MSNPSEIDRRIRVKFLSRVRLPDRNIGNDYLRRFPNQVPSWGNCDFIFDPDCREYDWLVVYDDLSRDCPVEVLRCSQENTLLLTGEPSSITRYGKRYLNQFGHVLSSQEPWAIQHPHIIRRQAGLLWYYGGSDQRGTYDSLKLTSPPAKTKLISSVCSTKAMKHTLHSLRLDFTKRLMADIPSLDVFGYGMGKLENKADAIDPYRYHLVIENHMCEHHWTEKLADAFLGYSLPIYFGCTNLDSYFPEDSYVWVDIRNYGSARDAVRKVIEQDNWEQRLPAIVEARRLVLETYSTFAQLADLVSSLGPAKSEVAAGSTIYGRRQFRKHRPLAGFCDWFDSCSQGAARPASLTS